MSFSIAADRKSSASAPASRCFRQIHLMTASMHSRLSRKTCSRAAPPAVAAGRCGAGPLECVGFRGDIIPERRTRTQEFAGGIVTSRLIERSRRRFLAHCTGAGLTSTLLPGVLWARVLQDNASRVTPEMLRDALAAAGLDATDEERTRMLAGFNQSLDRYRRIRATPIDEGLAPPLYFSPLVP